MNTIIISRDVWHKCFSAEYIFNGHLGAAVVKEEIAEKYGIEHWERLDLDNFKMTFTDEKKMAYWILRWS
jgi:hypothetical protein